MLSRRTFLKRGAATGTPLALGLGIGSRGADHAQPAPAVPDPPGSGIDYLTYEQGFGKDIVSESFSCDLDAGHQELMRLAQMYREGCISLSEIREII